MEEQTSYSDDLFGEVSEADVQEMTEADQPQEEEGTEAKEAAPKEEEQAQDAANDAAKDEEMFTLKYMDEERTFNRADMITLAQKGMDYERIRERAEREEKRAERGENLLKIINPLLKDGMSAEQFVNDMAKLAEQNAIQRRAQELAANGECTDEFALRMAEMEYRQNQLGRMQEEQNRKQAQMEAQRSQVGQFIMQNPAFREKFPDAQIPDEMVADIRGGMSIGEAWLKYQLEEANGKIKEYEDAKAQQEQQAKNAQAAAPKLNGDQSMENDPFVMALMGSD